ncbi:MAG TPA: hypothetical protein PLR74_13785, partial [Agriterribacter sp.]|nr:hypothetical protein [Agriterribacter sp.]
LQAVKNAPRPECSPVPVPAVVLYFPLVQNYHEKRRQQVNHTNKSIAKVKSGAGIERQQGSDCKISPGL